MSMSSLLTTLLDDVIVEQRAEPTQPAVSQSVLTVLGSTAPEVQLMLHNMAARIVRQYRPDELSAVAPELSGGSRHIAGALRQLGLSGMDLIERRMQENRDAARVRHVAKVEAEREEYERALQAEALQAEAHLAGARHECAVCTYCGRCH